MKENPSLTKNCMEPWKALFFRPDGKLAPCCGGPPPSGDFGNIYALDLHSTENGDPKDAFVNEAYRNLRRQLLEGDLQQACIDCRIVASDITTDLLRKKVEDHLRYCGRKISESTDLTREFAFTDCYTDVTDRCNFACIYCFLHSNDKSGKGHTEYIEVDRERFLEVIEFLAADSLAYLNFCWLGEFTMYPEWKELSLELFNKYPDMRLSLVSNFGRKFSDEDLDVLTRFFQIRISCDTLDPEKYAWLRRGGRLPVLIENINNLRARFKPGSVQPRLVFIVTESDAILSGLTDLGRFAVERNISIYISNMAFVEDSVATKANYLKKISELPDSQIGDAWEIIHDLPRRIRAAHPPIDYFFDLGPLYNAVKSRSESITLNRFIPSESDLVYKSFAAAQPKNPDIYLRKFFLSFDDGVKGIFIKSGMTVNVDLPFATGQLAYRPVFCKEIEGKRLRIFIGDKKTVVVGSKLSLSAIKCPTKFTHVLFEILSYEFCAEEDHFGTTVLESLSRIPLFASLISIAEYSDQRFAFAMAVSDFLKSYPGIHKYAESCYRLGIRLLSRVRKGES